MKSRIRFTSFLLCLFMILSVFLPACDTEKKEAKKEEERESTEVLEITTAEEEPEIQSTVEQVDPASDDDFNVLIIGNSFSTGWPDELLGLFQAAGKKLNIYTVYYSGCSLEQHWNWLQTGEGYYRFGKHISSGGGRVDKKEYNLIQCLSEQNWDVISLQDHFGPTVAIDYNASLEHAEEYAKKMIDYLKWFFPKTKIVWHQTWAYEVGYKKDGVLMIPNKEYRDKCYENIRDVSQKIARDNNIPLVPCGDAWQYARQSPEVVNLTRDNYHDGPEGGGQYLNACVWFESLTGESCIGNTWRPSYSYDEYKTQALQEAAHRACEENTLK